MALIVNGRTIETTEAGYLECLEDWNSEVCEALAKEEDIVLTDRHHDVIKYLRSEYYDNGGNQPMERAITKHMSTVWGEKLKSKDLYTLFPRAPSKQGLKVSGLPATSRKGGY